ncbi:helix-turn-helix domain-containing protein [Amycolatopsis sp. H20-H5]|uniref:helix-turn-helix domain-containing protein n=1 Tax=Amycolatopsis sp. H20-H5 TaxID=3046309 RepID=UPI002DBFC024|nr:helix-turn-helix domain-containing protein [Amycolatopsis sp. H20-H5]MEC3982724.1 helix-turn-helix domain-containing protein [Amycolatopsis sp. H20-H5]
MSVDWAVREPHPVLRPLIARYLGYVQDDVTLAVHRGLPSRHVTLVISLDRPVRVTGMPLPDQSPVTAQGLVGGLHLGPALIAQDRRQRGIHVELDPLGVRALLGVSAAELSGQVVALDQLGSPVLAELPERLAEAEDWSSRFAVLDRVLANVAAERAGTAEVGWAWRRLLGADGRLLVTTLADEVGWSRRHFGERFRAEVGLTPKQASRVLRFEQALRSVRGGGRVDLAEVAIRCGYYDQAHLSNEWRALAGCSPRTWIAEELPFLQDDDGAGGRDSSA